MQKPMHFVNIKKNYVCSPKPGVHEIRKNARNLYKYQRERRACHLTQRCSVFFNNLLCNYCPPRVTTLAKKGSAVHHYLARTQFADAIIVRMRSLQRIKSTKRWQRLPGYPSCDKICGTLITLRYLHGHSYRKIKNYLALIRDNAVSFLFIHKACKNRTDANFNVNGYMLFWKEK